MEESLKLFKILEKLRIEDASLILYCLLNRIPIVVTNNNSEVINEFINKLINLIPFRSDIIFGSKFNTQKEYLDFISEENKDYDSKRRVFISYCTSTPSAFKNIKNFKSWIIGLDRSIKINKILSNYLEIKIKSKTISIELIGIDKSSIERELSFETKLLKKFTDPKEIKKKTLFFNNFKKILIQTVSEDYLKFLANIDQEEEAINSHIFKTSILNFVTAAKKIFLILSKIHLIDLGRDDKNIEAPKLSKETLLDVINYHDASINRILSFIKEEYFGFIDYSEENKSIDFKKYVDISLIGAKTDYMRRMGGF
ncbi:MAG TPA: hypothetical protein VGB37_15090 [Candidatus Lokiarchaeia archaeon]